MLDSAQLFGLAPSPVKSWCDIGSGGGLPGVVVAVMAKHLAPDLSVTMIESDLRKATFLRTALRETGARGVVVSERIESVYGMDADILSARALAPLDKLLEFAELHLKSDGVALFPKGAKYREELRLALETWVFDCEEIPSATDPEAVILKLSEIARV